MNKEIFLIRLEQLLYDIPAEEREEAMDYYRSYFEDAGAENEASVLEELDSPDEIAASIKEDLKGPGEQAGRLKNPIQLRGKESDAQSRESRKEYSERKANYRRYDEPRDSAYSAQDTAADSSSYSRRYEQYGKQEGRSGGMDKQAKLILFIILAVFSFPLWGSLASIVAGFIGILIAVVIVLGIFSVGGVIGGVVCVIAGIAKLCVLSMVKGLLALGIGMLLIAGGGISFVFVLLLCGRLLPWAVRQVTGLFRRLLDWGRSMA